MSDKMITRPVKMEPAHPGAILARVLAGDEDNASVSIMGAAKAMGISRQTLHRVLAGKMGVTPEMAIRIGAFVGNGPGLWLRMQAGYDLWQAEHLKPRPKVVPIAEARKSREAQQRAIEQRIIGKRRAVPPKAAAKRASRRTARA